MRYTDPNPEHTPFVEEIQQREDFHGLWMHLPGSRNWYRGMYAQMLTQKGRLSKETRQLPLMWRAIDDFVAQTGFDVAEFLTKHDGVSGDPRAYALLHRDLCPLYVYLRACGFSQERITK
ncbi:MAG TPA: hypothetical protein VJH22_05230 [Candidatus Nanoarchaeia archaeon]|nr:hypothetical protein [Candidatus Nanoarchaeia archaeon]